MPRCERYKFFILSIFPLVYLRVDKVSQKSLANSSQLNGNHDPTTPCISMHGRVGGHAAGSGGDVLEGFVLGIFIYGEKLELLNFVCFCFGFASLPSVTACFLSQTCRSPKQLSSNEPTPQSAPRLWSHFILLYPWAKSDLAIEWANSFSKYSWCSFNVPNTRLGIQWRTRQTQALQMELSASSWMHDRKDGGERQWGTMGYFYCPWPMRLHIKEVRLMRFHGSCACSLFSCLSFMK